MDTYRNLPTVKRIECSFRGHDHVTKEKSCLIWGWRRSCGEKPKRPNNWDRSFERTRRPRENLERIRCISERQGQTKLGRENFVGLESDQGTNVVQISTDFCSINATKRDHHAQKQSTTRVWEGDELINPLRTAFAWSSESESPSSSWSPTCESLTDFEVRKKKTLEILSKVSQLSSKDYRDEIISSQPFGLCV